MDIDIFKMFAFVIFGKKYQHIIPIFPNPDREELRSRGVSGGRVQDNDEDTFKIPFSICQKYRLQYSQQKVSTYYIDN